MTIDPGAISPDTPLRLANAAEIAFPGGGMKVAGLRKERDAGRLETWFVAGKEFTSLAAVKEMIEKCRAIQRERASTFSHLGATRQAASSSVRSGLSETEQARRALDAVLMRCQPQKAR